MMNPREYDEYYDNPQARRENEELQRLINKHIPIEGSITDIGCGTGLGYVLTRPRPYTGIDQNAHRISYARAIHENSNFQETSLEDWIKNQDSFQHVIALFSLDHINPNTVRELLKKTKGTIIATTYAEPWLKGSSSEYAGDRERLEREAPHTKEVEAIFLEAGSNTTRLLQQPYYKIHIRK